ncbi:hypothetical protein VTH06DRAFT_2234 [Thermothelomyces fergusii]
MDRGSCSANPLAASADLQTQIAQARGRLARFAYDNGTNGSPPTGIDAGSRGSIGNGAAPAEKEEVVVKKKEEEEEREEEQKVMLGSDIEDAVKTAVSHARKRRRTGTAALSASRRPRPRPRPRRTRPRPRRGGRGRGCNGGGRPRGRVRKPARRTTDAATGAVTVEPPSDWEEMYELVRQMRVGGAAANAAVDTMGCERLADPEASPRERRFHTLVALMLSSQTRDEVNAEAMARLRAELPPHAPGARPGLTLENVLAADPACSTG